MRVFSCMRCVRQLKEEEENHLLLAQIAKERPRPAVGFKVDKVKPKK